jgi:hypothetical protein
VTVKENALSGQGDENPIMAEALDVAPGALRLAKAEALGGNGGPGGFCALASLPVKAARVKMRVVIAMDFIDLDDWPPGFGVGVANG